MNTNMKTNGRCIFIESFSEKESTELFSAKITLQNESGIQTYEVESPLPCQIGDIISIESKLSKNHVTVLTPNRSNGRMNWMNRTLSPRRRKAILFRQKVEQALRTFFTHDGFLEVKTPLLVESPGMEIHIRPFQTKNGPYLPTSPEFAMKKLLVGGLEKIFQITQSFRAEPPSKTHHPEFTMLEWYRAYAGLNEIMIDTEKCIEFIAQTLFGKPEIQFQGKTISVKTPWERKTVQSLFQEHLNLHLNEHTPLDELKQKCKEKGHTFLEDATWDDCFFLLFMNEIEPNLPTDKPIIVSHYPPSQAALSVIETNERGERFGKRFEFYIAGIECGNAFEELTHPEEQRTRFILDMNEREKIYGLTFPKSPIDESFLDALKEGMPPSGGIAVGVDRLIMLFADEPEIDQTLWLSSHVN